MTSKSNNKPSQKDNRKDNDRNDNDNDKGHNNNSKDCKPTPPPVQECKPEPVVCKPSKKDDCRDDRDDDRNHGKDKENCGPKKPNLYDCDNWGHNPNHNGHGNGHSSHGNGHGYGHNHGGCGPSQGTCTTVQVDHQFTGNTFPGNLVEGQAIVGATLAALGQQSSNMAINENTTIKGQITYEEGDYESTMGVFTIKADGTIQAVEMTVKNTDTVNASFEIDAGAGAKQLGFFLLPDGFNRFGGYDAYDIDAGSLKFVTNYGTPGAAATKVTDNGANVTLVFTTAGGEEVAVPGPYWFTNDRGGSNSLNSDGMVHTLSGVDPTNNEALIIAFEDKPQLYTDKDYNDVIFKVTMTDDVTVCKPCGSCEPTPPPPCKPVVDFCDPVSKAIADFVHGTSSKTEAFASSDNGHTTAAAILGVSGPSQVEDQSAYNVA